MALSAADYLTSNSISTRFQTEIIQPCVRVRGIDAIMPCRGSKESTVKKGNVPLVEDMIVYSRADLQLESKVIGIEHGQDRRYKISVSHGLGDATIEHHEFDMVA